MCEFKTGGYCPRCLNPNNECTCLQDFMPKNEMRKVFKIPIGDIPEEELDDYVKKIAEKFKAGEPLNDLNVEEIPSEDIFIPTKIDNEMSLPGAELDIETDIKYFIEKRDNLLERLNRSIIEYELDEKIEERLKILLRINKQLKLIEDTLIIHRITKANSK